MKLVYVAQPYDRFFPPLQSSTGLIAYFTALELSHDIAVTLYGRRYRNEVMPRDLPFEVRHIPVLYDRLLQRFIDKFPRVARSLKIDGRSDEHMQYYAEVRRSLAKDLPDIVHVMNYWPWSRGLKAAGFSHRLVLEMQCEWLSQRDRSQVGYQLEVVDAVVTVSDHIAKTFRDAFPDYPGIVATVGNGVDVMHFKPRMPSNWPLRTSKRSILFVGRVSPEKGIHTLVEAFREVANKFENVELQIAGPNWPLSRDFVTSLSSDPKVAALVRFYDHAGKSTYAQHLEELIARYGIRDRVHFIGNVSHKDLVATYQAADVVVNPSLSESFGISVVEGMASGIPVVGTRIGGMCETILSGITGMLVEADEPVELARALISVLEDPLRAKNMGIEGRKRAVELFSWQARAERLMAVYNKLASAA